MDRSERENWASEVLLGVTVGDSLGESFFCGPTLFAERVANKAVPPGPWFITDDSVMAIGILNCLKRDGELTKDKLAAEFAENFTIDPWRGYGGFAQELLRYMGFNSDWEEKVKSAFGGTGSMGNGAAMRICPLGAWFQDDLSKLLVQAIISAQVTHYHDEAAAGAIAVAVATALACRQRGQSKKLKPKEFIEFIIQYTPESITRNKLVHMLNFKENISNLEVALKMGNGDTVLSQDTVPFVIWAAAHNLDNFEEAMWYTIAAKGDIDTNCAMVGGIVIAHLGASAIPEQWKKSHEGPAKFLK